MKTIKAVILVTCLLTFSSFREILSATEPSNKGLQNMSGHAGKTVTPFAFDYSRLKLIDEIIPATDGGSHEMRQSPNQNASEIQDILGQKCLVLKPSSDVSYVAYKIGAGKGLKAKAAYVLVVDYPEDKSRTIFVKNSGCETGSGFSTGQAVGDSVIGKYVNNNPESLKYPLANEYRRWNQFFYLHDRFADFVVDRNATERKVTPDKGFWVFISQFDINNDPMSAGAAISRIALYEVENPSEYNVVINYPPSDLPRRHIFNREEMADGVAAVPHGEDKPMNRGVDNPNDWFEFKMKNLRFLGMNTFSKDLLEFGHNQGWDPGDNGGWVQSPTPQRWHEILNTIATRYKDLYVLPYYEYGGSTGRNSVGHKKTVMPLKNTKKMFTHIEWLEKNAHIDILDPDALADAKKMLDSTIVRYKESINFVGAWFRPRPSQMPISFSDAALAKYAQETDTTVTRQQLAADRTKLDTYYKWWFVKRQAFLAALAKHLRDQGVNNQAILLFTTDSSEPGISLPGNVVATDDVEAWTAAFSSLSKKRTPISFEKVVTENLYGKEMSRPIGSTWGEWEWHHACPGAAPDTFKDKSGTIVSYSFNRLYTVAVPETLESFRSPDGLAIVRHYTLNENMMHDAANKETMGYFVADVDRAGPYCMMAEARAMANGDPRFIGYLNANSMARGFPEYVRAFNAAFLSLPALPSRVLPDASSDPEVVIRVIPAGRYGYYIAIVNTGLESKKDVVIRIPQLRTFVDTVSGTGVKTAGNNLILSMYPGQLRTFRGN